jgi:hypothetical protein
VLRETVEGGHNARCDSGKSQGPRSEDPDAPENKENRGNRNDLVNEIFRGTGTQETLPGRQQRIGCDRLRGLHLAPAFLCAFAAVYCGMGRNPMVTATAQSLRLCEI